MSTPQHLIDHRGMHARHVTTRVMSVERNARAIVNEVALPAESAFVAALGHSGRYPGTPDNEHRSSFGDKPRSALVLRATEDVGSSNVF